MSTGPRPAALDGDHVLPPVLVLDDHGETVALHSTSIRAGAMLVLALLIDPAAEPRRR